MKQLLLCALFTLPFLCNAQDFTIKINDVPYNDKIPSDVKFKTEVKTLEIKKNTADKPPKTFTLVSGNSTQSFSTDGNYHTLSFPQDLRGDVLNIKDDKDKIVGTSMFVIQKQDEGSETTGGTKIEMPAQKTATQFLLGKLYKDEIIPSDQAGLQIKAGSKNTQYSGKEYYHLFFDQNGNSLLRSIPIGISRAKYVVHVIYLVAKDNPTNVEYYVDQKAADISEDVVIRGDGSLQSDLHLQALDPNKVTKLEWRHSEKEFTPSDDDIEFDIVKGGLDLSDGVITPLKPEVVVSKVIKMKKIYHGSVDVGIIKTNLANPDYSLVTSDVDPTQSVVKRTSDDSRVLASAMYTFYVSPVVLIEKLLFPSSVKNYQLEGRNFVDDHRIYERIYPTAGIGLNNRLLDDIFIGGKWEFIRGGSLFVGYHWGKINVLNVDEGFEFGKTNMTKETFDLKLDKKYRGAFCAGLNLDLRIIANIFQKTAAQK